VTIGIAVSGPCATQAALAALRAVEAVGRGAIGGFVSLVAIEGGELLSADTQTGGAAALFPNAIPDRMASARLAALMSSGPNRPEPLIQFTPGDPAAGLLTGHRLPNMPGSGGVAPNVLALNSLRQGASPAEAVEAAMAAEPEADAGLIAVGLDGIIAMANSAAVARRDDIGAALVDDVDLGMRIGVLHNSIFPNAALADLAVAAALDAVAPADKASASDNVIGRTVTLADRRALEVTSSGEIRSILVPDPVWLSERWEGSVVWRGDDVMVEGQTAGRVVTEVYCTLESGLITGSRGGNRVSWKLER